MCDKKRKKNDDVWVESRMKYTIENQMARVAVIILYTLYSDDCVWGANYQADDFIMKQYYIVNSLICNLKLIVRIRVKFLNPNCWGKCLIDYWWKLIVSHYNWIEHVEWKICSQQFSLSLSFCQVKSWGEKFQAKRVPQGFLLIESLRSKREAENGRKQPL